MASDFDGDNDIINYGSNGSIDNVFTGGGSQMAWIRPDNVGEGSGGTIADKRAGVDEGGFFKLQDESGSDMDLQKQQSFTTANGSWVTTDREIQANVWNLAGVTYDSSSVANNPVLYVDGVSVGITEANTPIGTVDSDAAQDLMIGNRLAGDKTFDGEISFFVQWNVILSANEMAIINRGVNPFVVRNSNIELLTPLGGNQSPEPDYSGNGNTGTVTGAIKGAGNPPVQLISRYMESG